MVSDTETEVIRMKGAAKAEVMEKEAKAYQKHISAAVMEMMIKALPEVADKIAEPLTQVNKVTIIGGGSDNSGMDNVAGNVATMVARLFESMKETTRIGLGEIAEANTYDAKVSRDIRVTGVSESDVIDGEVVKNIIEDSVQ